MKDKDGEKAINTWNENYSRRNKIDVISGAVRVEQGEYSVADLNTPIGTYNVKQCTVIHAINKEKNLHGLAHIDGNAEAQSLDTFFKELGLEPNKHNIEIQILGSTSSHASRLDNSQTNLAKVENYLNREDIKSGLTNDNIKELINNRNTSADFIIDGSGKVTNGLAEDRLLHTLQEVKRKDAHIGTYPLSKAASANDNDKTIFLDERALVKLAEYKENPKKDIEERSNHGMTIEVPAYEIYDASIPIILKYWDEAVNNITAQGNTDKKYDEKELKNLIANTPIYVGENSEVKNTEIINCIKNSSDINNLKDNLLLTSKNSSTIDSALEIVKQYDPELNTDKVLESLTNNYNEKHKTDLRPDQIAKKSYGGEISIEEFINEVGKKSEFLNALIVLNSESGYSLSSKPYTINEAKEAANIDKLKDKNLVALLDQQIIEHNEYGRKNITVSPDDLYKVAIEVANEEKITFSRRDDIILKGIIREKLNNNQIDGVISKISSITDKQKFMDKVDQKIQSKIEEEILIRNISDKDKYSNVQAGFLKKANLPSFTPLEISLKLAGKVEDKNTTQTHDITYAKSTTSPKAFNFDDKDSTLLENIKQQELASSRKKSPTNSPTSSQRSFGEQIKTGGRNSRSPSPSNSRTI